MGANINPGVVVVVIIALIFYSIMSASLFVDDLSKEGNYQEDEDSEERT